MKKQSLVALVSSMFFIFMLYPATKSNAEVNVNIAVPLPPLVFPAPPALIVIPGTYAYYPPDVSVDIFFYHGHWYRPYQGRWFISAGYNGPWRSITVERVPGTLRGLPPHYRRVPPGYERMPYGRVEKNWRAWERERYWDQHERRRDYREDEGRGEHRGPGRGQGKRGMRGRHDDD